MNKVKNLPLYIKIPIILAVFLALVLGFVTVFENTSEDNSITASCKIRKSGDLAIGGESLSLLSHLYWDPRGYYVVAGLDQAKNSWLVGKMGFAADLDPYWELKNKQENPLRSSENHQYSVEGSFDDWAILKDETGRRIPIYADANKISAKNSLGVCTGNWDSHLNMQRLNSRYMMLWNGLGQIGFYDLARFSEFIPKGAARSADLLMTVDAGNTLNVGNCAQLAVNKKARIKADQNLLSYSSGDTADLSIYKVSTEDIKLTPVPSPLQTGILSDFVVGGPGILGMKTSSWLDSSETWSLTSIEGNQKAVTTAKPLGFRSDYSLEPQVNSTYWVAEQRKNHLFFDHFILTKVDKSGEKLSFEVDDPVVRQALLKANSWTVLPGNRHLFAGGLGGKVQYSLVDCNSK